MSGIYIPGMEMPSSCWRCEIGNAEQMDNRPCPFYSIDGEEQEKYTNSRHPNCPLIPVPDHGRLIDADALTGQMERNLWAIEDKAEEELGFDETLRRGMQYGHAVCVDAVNAAPTIIPADKEGET